MQLRGLIFDLDGTLADNLPEVFAAFRAGLARASGRHYSDPEIFSLFGPTPEQIFQQAAPDAPDRWAQATEEFYGVYVASLAVAPLVVSGLEALLDWATAQGLRLAVVTGGSQRHLSITMDALGFRSLFDMVRFGAEDWTKQGNLAHVLGEWGLPGEQVAYVSDSPRDMELALNQGLLPLGAAWARGAQPEGLRAAGALEVFASPEALQQWLAVGAQVPLP